MIDANKWNKKLKKARADKSTSVFYDSDYWKEYWKERFGKESISVDESSTKSEALKKLGFVKRKFPHVKSVLAIGCAFGAFVYHSRKAGYNTHGIDVSEYAISIAPEEIREFLKVGNIIDLPYKENEFELVTCFDILEHLFIEEIFSAVDEVVRVASHGIFCKLPVSGYEGEVAIVDRSYESYDKSHVSVYPWDFWIRRFVESGKFELVNCSMYLNAKVPKEYYQNSIEGWIAFRRKK